MGRCLGAPCGRKNQAEHQKAPQHPLRFQVARRSPQQVGQGGVDTGCSVQAQGLHYSFPQTRIVPTRARHTQGGDLQEEGDLGWRRAQNGLTQPRLLL